MRFLFVILVTAFFTTSVTLPASAQRFRPPGLTKIKKKKRTRIRVLAFSEYGARKPDYKIFKKKIDQIREREIIRLDLTIISHPARFQEGTPCNGNDWGSVRTGPKSSYHFLPVPDNYHIIFQILPGTAERLPFSSVSCIYNPTSPRKVFMRFSGYFVVHHHVVPTAVIHEFRAITPPTSFR